MRHRKIPGEKITYLDIGKQSAKVQLCNCTPGCGVMVGTGDLSGIVCGVRERLLRSQLNSFR